MDILYTANWVSKAWKTMDTAEIYMDPLIFVSVEALVTS